MVTAITGNFVAAVTENGGNRDRTSSHFQLPNTSKCKMGSVLINHKPL